MKNINAFPSGVLQSLVQQVRRLRQDARYEGADGSNRRHLAREVKGLCQAFDQILGRWVTDASVAAKWRGFLHDGGLVPEGPRFQVAPLFRGTAANGAAVSVVPASDGGYDIEVDGTVSQHEAVPWHLDPDMMDPVEIEGQACVEDISAPAQAVDALRAFVSGTHDQPPWRWGRELVEDGLVTRDFELTPRGRRCLARRGQGARIPAARTRYALIVADAGRAKFLSLDVEAGQDAAPAQLVQVGHDTSPEARARPGDILSDTRPGLRREGPNGPRHGVSDRREHHLEVVKTRFATRVMKEARGIWPDPGPEHIVLVAPPAMLGRLRPLCAAYFRLHAEARIAELGRNLTALAPPALHDALASAGLLPGRQRRPSLRPVRARERVHP